MNVLALDTSTRWAALAVARADGARFEAPAHPQRLHGQELVPAIQALLDQAGLRVRDLEALAVGLGPGSFTGLRIGLTVIKTLAYATKRPMVGLESLRVIAHNAPAEARRVAVVAEAQRGDLFAAEFTRTEPGGPLVPTAPTGLVSRDLWVQRLVPGTFVVGPPWERLGLELPSGVVVAEPSAHRPRGSVLVDLALEALQAGRRDEPWFLEPIYLRPSAAEEKWPASR